MLPQAKEAFESATAYLVSVICVGAKENVKREAIFTLYVLRFELYSSSSGCRPAMPVSIGCQNPIRGSP